MRSIITKQADLSCVSKLAEPEPGKGAGGQGPFMVSSYVAAFPPWSVTWKYKLK